MHLRLNERPFATTAPAVGPDQRYHPVSYWQETVAVAPGPPLDADLDCDVAIIGAGYTGLSTAYELKRSAPALDVVLLERAVVGHGASGRNGGFAMPLLGFDLSDAVAKLGQRVAGDAYRLMYDAVDHLKRLVHDERIDCDLEETGYLLLATSKRRVSRLRHETELGQRLGFDWRWLEGATLEEHIRSPKFLAGLYDPRPAIIHPAKLARGLKTIVEGLGVRVFEQTPIVELRDGAPITLRTPRATARAKRVVLAVNGYGAALGFMESRVFPVHTYIAMTEPISNADLEAIGWAKRRTSLETARNFIHYFRLTADHRILFGGEDAHLYFNGALHDAHGPTFDRLEARFRSFFPSLARTRFTHHWGGALGVTLDLFPTFGKGGEKGTIFHGAGYSGHGVALANFAGKLLAPAVLESLGQPAGEIRRPFFFDRLPYFVPREPFRYLGMQSYRRWLQMDDWLRGA